MVQFRVRRRRALGFASSDRSRSAWGSGGVFGGYDYLLGLGGPGEARPAPSMTVTSASAVGAAARSGCWGVRMGPGYQRQRSTVLLGLSSPQPTSAGMRMLRSRGRGRGTPEEGASGISGCGGHASRLGMGQPSLSAGCHAVSSSRRRQFGDGEGDRRAVVGCGVDCDVAGVDG